MTSAVGGYVADIPYLRDFKPMLAPAWLDHVALVGGVEPPSRERGFAWCDLGCGQGVTAAVLAATHPRGMFDGIDAMPVHIDHGRRLAAAAGAANAEFHQTGFAAAADLDGPLFDYIVAHGVYTWIDTAAREALRRFIDRRLKPGGLVYVGYNAMPGWARDLPFQRLVRELGETFSGGSAGRFAAAAAVARRLAGEGVPALVSSCTLGELEHRAEDYSPAYLVHEFMHGAWQPLYVTEIRADMAAIGLTPVGSATLVENFDHLVLGPAARATLAGIADPDVCELVRDFYLDQRFRRDVFARGNRRLGAGERADRLLSGTFALARPARAADGTAAAPVGAAAPRAGDTPGVQAIVGALSAGPRSLAELAGDPAGAPELLEDGLTMCAIGDAMPVEPRRVPVDQLNRVILGRLDGAEEILWLALPCGTAVPVERALLRRLRDGAQLDDDRFPGWAGFLAAHGI